MGFYGISCGIAILYFIIAVLFKGIFFPLSILALGIIIAIVLFEIANFYSKVSIHVAAACAYVVTIGVLYGPAAFLLSWWIAPLVAWSRIYLKKHTSKEAAGGAVLGCFVTIITFLIAKLLL